MQQTGKSMQRKQGAPRALPRVNRTRQLAAQRTRAEQSASDATQKRQPSPLEKGGTLSGEASRGKDAGPAAKKAVEGAPAAEQAGSAFDDPRWVNGTWDLQQFTRSDGKVDWDAVIDAEIERRRKLELNPEASTSSDPVRFTPDQIPWWAWVRRFHLPEAERVNGRAAMIGFVSSYVVDALSGAGVVDQMGSFFGKLSLFLSVLAIALIRNSSDIAKYRSLINEAVFYDQQWDATWKESSLPKETEQ